MSHPRLLTDWPSTGEFVPEFSPDGRTFAFQSNRDARTSDVWTVPAAGGTPTRITKMDALTTLWNWSPDGRSVLVTTGSASSTTYRVPVDRGNPERLPVPAGAQSPRWSPGGRQIAYTEIVGGYSYLGVLTLGGQARRLTTVEQSYDLNPVWSPDGTQLAWDSYDLKNSSEDIHVINVADGTVRKVTATPDVSEFGPRWTPDGRSIVFNSMTRGATVVTANVAKLLETAPAAGQK